MLFLNIFPLLPDMVSRKGIPFTIPTVTVYHRSIVSPLFYSI